MPLVKRPVLPPLCAALAALLLFERASAQDYPASFYEIGFVQAGDVRLHYLDFGGEGLPVVFVHSEGWDAHTYEDFAPRFTDRNRVLAVTRPGYGESEAHPGGFGVEAQARSLIEFLDALGIEQAVFAGNSSPVVYLTYLAEHYPGRVAGVIYLAGLMPMWLNGEAEADPTGAGAMAARARAPDPVARERSRVIDSYRPRFLSGRHPTIDVPALAFAGRSGLIGYERFSWPLALVGSPLMREFHADLPPSPATDYLRRLVDDTGFRNQAVTAVEDSTARGFLIRLADDPALQADVWRYQQDTVRPALVAGQERFRRAFERIRIVRLDVSTIYGYEYRDTPALIEPHIRQFLEEVK
jgi:pimeloyl-ACP methyl ester carboxylesterase